MSHHILRVRTDGRGFFDISRDVQSALEHAAHDAGICHVFIRHTSASLLITENAAPEVRDDLERFFARLVADGDPLFSHDDEGPDDMPAHIRCALTQTSLSIPFADKRLLLGTWQGIYL
ncbi:MAG: secondary thiamine-phosphate synthase enzyme YjbQ, partial [Pseudomonadota bacterium]